MSDHELPDASIYDLRFDPAASHHTRVVLCCFLCQENLRCNITWPSRFDPFQEGDGLGKEHIPFISAEDTKDFRFFWYMRTDDQLVTLYRYVQDNGTARAMIPHPETWNEWWIEPKYVPWWQHYRVNIGESRRQLSVCYSLQQPGDYCDRCDDDNLIYLMHNHCYQATQHPSRVSVADLALYAHHVRPLMPFGEWDAKAKSKEMAFRRSDDLLLNPSPRATHLGDMLYRISELPQELVNMIMVELEGTMTLACLKARRAVRHLLPQLKVLELIEALHQPTWSNCWKGRPVGAPHALYASTTEILGQSYVTGIGLNDDRVLLVNRRKYQLSVPNLNKAIYGLECSLSSFGVTAIRILYTDYTESDWLGHWSITDTWRTVIYGPDLKALQVLSDGLRIIRVGFDPSNSTQAEYNRTQDTLVRNERVLRIRSMLSSTQTWFNHYRDVAYWRAATTDVSRALGYPGCKVCETVSFINRSGQYMSGLTVCFSEQGIQGIQAHFPDGSGPNMVGSTGAYRIHLGLCKKEYLTSAWLYEVPFEEQTPFVGGNIILAFTTSRRRTQVFTSETTRLKAMETEFSHWSCLTSKAHTKVTGLMVDVFGFGERRAYIDFGVTEQKNFPSPVDVADEPYYPELESTFALIPPIRTHRTIMTEGQLEDSYYFIVEMCRIQGTGWS